MSCSQCHGCAYKPGAAANLEGQNFLRGVFAALGGYPFYCHQSLGWAPGQEHYPEGAEEALAILSSRHMLIRAGACIDSIDRETADLRRKLRICGGWRSAVRRLKASGWYSNPSVRYVRRHFAKTAAACVERLTKAATVSPEERSREEAAQDLQDAIAWFFEEARAEGIKIGWLFNMESLTDGSCAVAVRDRKAASR